MYADGYASGLKDFCTKDSGLRWGRKGKDYLATCPRAIENDFLNGYSKGNLEYEKLQIEKKKADALEEIAKKKECTFNFDCKAKDGRCEFDSFATAKDAQIKHRNHATLIVIAR